MRTPLITKPNNKVDRPRFSVSAPHDVVARLPKSDADLCMRVLRHLQMVDTLIVDSRGQIEDDLALESVNPAGDVFGNVDHTRKWR